MGIFNKKCLNHEIKIKILYSYAIVITKHMDVVNIVVSIEPISI